MTEITDSIIDGFQDLSELEAACMNCQRCGLHKHVTQVVPGEGSDKAIVMFIGEGPGANEDKTGRPFVGAAGKFLDELLDSINLKRKDIYIANTVKCRPPENRDPTEAEKESCRPWLDAQIRLINPAIFVPLGRHAFHMFVPDEKISQAHGRFFTTHKGMFAGKIIFAMYHPAAALYNGSMRPTLLKDMQGLRKILNSIEKHGRDKVQSLVAEEDG